MRRCLIIIALLLGLVVVAQTVNHNAVLITGDTPEGAHLKAEKVIENGDTTGYSGLWGLEQYKRTRERGYFNSFWNDTYLLWELLYNKDWPDENIHFSS